MRTHMCLVIALTSFAAVPSIAGDSIDSTQAGEQHKALDLIEAKIIGRLNTWWDTDELHFASVEAGGTEIELDPNGCPKITRELLEFQKTQGGAFTTGIQVEATGYLFFDKRPDTARFRISRGDPGATVPVLKVATIKITILPKGKDIGQTKRDRPEVASTTVTTGGTTDKHSTSP